MYNKIFNIVIVFIVSTITGFVIFTSIEQKRFQTFVINKLRTVQIEADVSILDSSVCDFTDKSANIWLISYAANGEVNFANQRALTSSAINKCIDFIKPYNDRHIDQEFATKNSEILKMPRGAGYWLWKPYMILKTLQEIPENDVVIYLDSSIIIKNKLDSLVNYLNNDNKDIIIFDLPSIFSIRKYTKRELLKIMNMDTDQVGDTAQRQASFIVVKNNANARKIMQEWLNISTDKDAITDSPSSLPEYSEFIDHRHDQAILALLSIKYAQNFEILTDSSKYFHHHRRRSKQHGSVFELK